MQAAIQTARYYATLRASGIRPAVWWALASLEGGFGHHHWAGLTSYTKPFGVAAGYVFGKQSGGPCHCDLHSPPTQFGDEHRHPFYRSYGANLPSSLGRFYLSCLSLLSQGTCVGSRYGFLASMHDLFTGSGGQQLASPEFARCIALRFTSSSGEIPSGILPTPKQSRALSEARKCRNINRLPFRHARLGHGLGAD